MSDNRTVYRRITTKLKQLYPKQLTGNQARHMNTLAGMITGIVQSKSCQPEAMARKIPEKSKVKSREKKIVRLLKNDRVEEDTYFMPFIVPILQRLARKGTLTLAIDGSVTGRGCLTLMISVIYQKRAIPLAWLVVKGKKGHLSEEKHLELLEKVKPLIPNGSDVIFLGDGEFDGTGLQAEISRLNWWYVCRTAKNRIICADGEQFPFADIHLQPGDCIDLPDVGFTKEDYRPVMVIGWWHRQYEQPIYLVTNMECVDEACFWYRKRYRIETFFSDQKSRGFHLNKSHISDPERISRLLIASCLAYIWMIYLGVKVIKEGLLGLFHRTDRCDLSLFQCGFRYLEYLLNEMLELPFSLSIPA